MFTKGLLAINMLTLVLYLASNILSHIKTGCIPVLVNTDLNLPYNEKIDWSRAIVRMNSIKHIAAITTINEEAQTELRKRGRFIFDKFFSDIEAIFESFFVNFNEKIATDKPSGYEYWNGEPELVGTGSTWIRQNGLAEDIGFTAIILTYNRLESLWRVVRRLSAIKSCKLILIIWQDQERMRPQESFRIEYVMLLLISATSPFWYRFEKQSKIDNWPEFTTKVIIKTPSGS